MKCYRSDKFDYTAARVCSRHFEKKDYERNFRYELLGLPIPTTQIKLLEDAVPSLCSPLFPHNKRKLVVFEDKDEGEISGIVL